MGPPTLFVGVYLTFVLGGGGPRYGQFAGPREELGSGQCWDPGSTPLFFARAFGPRWRCVLAGCSPSPAPLQDPWRVGQGEDGLRRGGGGAGWRTVAWSRGPCPGCWRKGRRAPGGGCGGHMAEPVRRGDGTAPLRTLGSLRHRGVIGGCVAGHSPGGWAASRDSQWAVA